MLITLIGCAAHRFKVRHLALTARVASQTDLMSGVDITGVVTVARVLRHAIRLAAWSVPVVVAKRGHSHCYAVYSEKKK
jgi:hypothetical protein